MYYLYTYISIRSEEQLVECDDTNYGCDGGWPSGALQYVIDNGGSYSEDDFPYTSGDGVIISYILVYNYLFLYVLLSTKA